MEQLNRHICALAPLPAEPTDRIELIPVGVFRTADQRPGQPFRIADAAQVIAASFEAAPGGSLLIDFDHRSFGPQGAQDSRAAGWITAMEVDGDRIMAAVDWTAEGRAALDGRAYRFVSPVFRTRNDGSVALIEGAGLVNNPALPQLRQLASKDEDRMTPIEQIAGLLGVAADKPDEIEVRVTALLATETQLASIIAAAGVSGDDTTTQICTKLTAKTPDPAQFVPMSAFAALQTQLASLQKTVGDDRAEAALEKARADGKLIPAMEDWATQLASKDLAQFEAWAGAAPVLVEPGKRQLAGRMPPARHPADKLNDMERQVASQMGIKAEDFLATRNAQEKV